MRSLLVAGALLALALLGCEQNIGGHRPVVGVRAPLDRERL